MTMVLRRFGVGQTGAGVGGRGEKIGDVLQVVKTVGDG